MIRGSTRAVIEEAFRHSVNYRNGFANHLPMALVALDAMGASEAQMLRFTRAYETQLEPVSESELASVREFEDHIEREGAAKVLRNRSSMLARGVGSGAFHGAIRTAYAMESGIPGEIARALVYWTKIHEPLPDLPLPSGTAAPLEILRDISRDPMPRPPGRGISERMRTAVAHPTFNVHVARLSPAALEIRVLADALIRAYCATGDFTLLHGVTGCHALRLLSPHFESRSEAIRHLWTAIVAAYMSCGSPSLEEGWKLRGSDRLSWSEIHGKAAECDDEHDVKFAYSCWREWETCGNELYRRAASARVCHALESMAAC